MPTQTERLEMALKRVAILEGDRPPLPRWNGTVMRIERLRTGMSQSQLGRIIRADQRQVSRWEIGLSSPPGDRVCAIARALGLSMECFFRATDRGNERAAS